MDDWNDIIAVAAGKLHTLGLKSDGTVLATGDCGIFSSFKLKNGSCLTALMKSKVYMKV